MKQEITITSVYGELIRANTRLDEMEKRNDRVSKRFGWAVIAILILEITNILVHLFVKR